MLLMMSFKEQCAVPCWKIGGVHKEIIPLLLAAIRESSPSLRYNLPFMLQASWPDMKNPALLGAGHQTSRTGHHRRAQ